MMELRREMLMTILNGNIKTELIKTYTLEESWENDQKGNPISIFSALELSSNMMTDYCQLLLCNFRGNQASITSYKVDYIIFTKDGNTGSQPEGFCVRNNATITRAISNSTSTWASIGTTIEVYKLTVKTY